MISTRQFGQNTLAFLATDIAPLRLDRRHYASRAMDDVRQNSLGREKVLAPVRSAESCQSIDRFLTSERSNSDRKEYKKERK